MERERVFSCHALVIHDSPGQQQAPNLANFTDGTWKPRIAPHRGQQSVKAAYGSAGLGGRKKRMPGCNGPDTGFNVTLHESAPTFDWSYLARELTESL